MTHYPYLIVGGGMTADFATRGIRQLDPDRPIGLIGMEPDPPYNRPPLSKNLWKGKPLDSIWLKTAKRGVDLMLDRRVRALDVANKRVTDDQGVEYTYDKLLLATGGTPRHLPFGQDRVVYYRTVEDYRRVREAAQPGTTYLVIGGGFIGSEMAAALAMNDVNVVMVFPESGIGALGFPADLADFLTSYYRDKGVDVQPGMAVVGIEAQGDKTAVRVRPETGGDEREYVVDGVIAGIGIRPNVELAQSAGIAVNNGIIVDERLRTNQPDVYAAGDAAAYFQPQLDERRRVEHEDNAKIMGRHAGRIMAGEAEPYTHLPLFYSDLFDLGYEAVGDFHPRLEVVADWQEKPFKTGVVYYLRDHRVRGVLLWNVWGQVDHARQLIADPGPFTKADLIGRLPANKPS